MKKCIKCNKPKESTEFQSKSRLDKRPRNTCRECTNTYKRLHYKNNSKYRNFHKERVRKQRARNTENNRRKLLEYLESHPCVNCGEINPIVLEFDHVNKKYKDISFLIGAGYTWSRVREEINNCQVLCSNCHKIKTSKQLGWYKSLMGNSGIEPN